jgi:uncharacterized protein YraI
MTRRITAISACIAVGLAAGVAFSEPAAAQSSSASVTTTLNMREGPSTGYRVLYAIPAGTVVPIFGCTSAYSWCQVAYGGRNGWVSARYLRDTRQAYNNRPVSDVGAQLGIALINFIIGQIAQGGGGQPTPPPGPGPGPGFGQACFYEHFNYEGASFCARAGQQYASLNRFNDRISSIRVGPGVSVQACEHFNYEGRCNRYTGRNAQLAFNDAISSIRIGGPQQAGPAQVCFYEHWDFSGNRFCASEGDSRAFVTTAWNDRISSIQVSPGASVQVCQHANFDGWCDRFNSNVRRLTENRNDQISSFTIN